MMDVSSRLKLIKQLKFMLDLHSPLLDKLYRDGILSDEQDMKLDDKTDCVSNIDQVLDHFAIMTCEQLGKFFEALNDSNQGHVTQYIQCNGIKPVDDSDNNWPLYDTSQWHKIKANWPDLIDFIDSYYDLLNEMVAAGCITRQHAEYIDISILQDERNRKLLRVLRKRSLADYSKFIDCLLKTNQAHVVSLLEPEKAGESRPLSPDHKRRLESNSSTLIENIVVETCELLQLMEQNGCITSRQRKAIVDATDKTKGVKLLLDILLRGSQQKFNWFISFLIRIGQEHLCKLLVSNVVSAEIDARSSGSVNIEVDLVETIKNLLSNCNPDDRERLYNCKVGDIMEQFERHDVELLSLQPRHSIRLYFICRSLAGVQYLKELYDSGDLRNIVQLLFRSSLEDAVNIVVEELYWSKPNYENCLQFFMTDTLRQCLPGDAAIRMTEKPAIQGGATGDDDIKLCPICKDEFVDPRLLPCLHTFCYKCIFQLWSHLRTGDSFVCPICHREVVIPSDGICGFSRDLLVQGVSDAKKVMDKAFCEACTANANRVAVTATKYCVECRERLCESCSKTHANVNGDTHLVKELKAELERCAVHENQLIEHYCFDCKCNICTECLAVEHQRHRWQGVEKAAVDIMRDIDRSVDAVMGFINETTQQEARQQAAVNSFVLNVASVENAIDERYSEIKSFIDYERLQLFEQLQTMKDQALKDLKKIEEENRLSLVAMKRFITFAKELKSEAQACDITRIGCMIHDRALELLTSYSVPKAYSGPDVAFKAANIYDVLTSPTTCNLVGQLMVNGDITGGADRSPCIDTGNFAADLNCAKERLAFIHKLLQEKDETISQLERRLRDNDEGMVKSEREFVQQTKQSTELTTQPSQTGMQLSEEETVSFLKICLYEAEQRLETAEKEFKQQQEQMSATIDELTAQLAKGVQLSAETAVQEDVESTAGTITHVIAAHKGRTGPVSGVTVLGNELFIVRLQPKGRVEVYKATSCLFKRYIAIKEHDDSEVMGLASCNTNKCLYVSYITGYIHKVDLTGHNNDSVWKVEDDGQPQGLSVNSKRNLIVACIPQKLIEYTTRGKLVNEIHLPNDVEHPLHTIQLSNKQFLVSHGFRDLSSHRVCIVDANERVISCYGDARGSESGLLNSPQQLARDSYGCIRVADMCNNRIVVLDSALKWSQEMQIVGGGVNKPYSLYLDEKRKRLFVGEWNGEESRVVVVKL